MDPQAKDTAGARKVRDYLDLVAAARTAASRAAALIRAAPPPGPDAWEEKGRHDYATAVDRDAERLIAETLVSLVPGSQVQGEELTPGGSAAAEVVWVVDPIDGTTNFLHGYPQFAVSIGCVVRGALCVGVVHDVPRDLVYHAAAGQGAWSGTERLAVSTVQDPKHALVGTGFPFRRLPDLDRYLPQLGRVITAASAVRRAGSAALDLVDVAAGRLDAFWELLLSPWDVAAGALLVREAGGVITTLDGEEDVLRGGSIVAGNPALHRWLLQFLTQS